MTCEICQGEQHDPTDHPFLPKIQELNMDVKSDPEGIEEGGMGSGRTPEVPGESGGTPAGELITFETVSIPGGLSGVDIGGKKIEETIMKSVLDTKVEECPCKNSHRK